VGLGSDSTFAKGDRVDRFEIDALIAEGGMGAIYRAVDTRLQRTIALKVVRADRLDSSAGDEARQRFLREALAVSKVDHRNVVRVFDFGFAGDTPYLAMEYLRGRDLGKLLKSTSGFLPVADVVDVMLSVCAAIRACHDAGIIHRDLKPSNVFLCDGDGEPEVKILDFGVSKPPIANDLTRDGQIVGTPQYLAPEQIDGNAVPQTDQYAIGVMLYACLTKALPYQNHASLGLLRAIVLGQFPPPRALRAELPEKLEAIVLRAMRGAPEDRFESVHALGRELLEFGSAGARERWRAYYLEDRLKAPPKASTHAMPLIEAMARGLPTAPSADRVAFASTLATPGSAPKPAAGDPPPAAAAAAVTKAYAAPPTVDLVQPPASASASASAVTTNRGRRATGIVVAIAGALALSGSTWFVLRRPRVTEAPKVVAPASATAAPATNPRPSLGPPRETASTTTSVPAPEAPSAAPAQVEKHHRRNHRRPAAEQATDGVPIMP
jgi:tRNA A-37 threonylcarbamoyl transferase component Bud32